MVTDGNTIFKKIEHLATIRAYYKRLTTDCIQVRKLHIQQLLFENLARYWCKLFDRFAIPSKLYLGIVKLLKILTTQEKTTIVWNHIKNGRLTLTRQ